MRSPKIVWRIILFAACLLLVQSAALAAAPDPFTVVLMPDTQNYAENYPETYFEQCRWIKDQAKAENIRFAIHLGDLVQHFSATQEWVVADKAHRILDGVVPYSVVPGNHDLDYEGERLTRGVSQYHRYFPPSRFAAQPWYGGHMGESNACNYCFFEVDDLEFMVLSLAFAPGADMLAWADRVLKQHPERRVILVTHFYMRPEGRGKEKNPYGLDGLDGEGLWEHFIRKQEQIFMVVSGHVLGVHHQISTNDFGKPVIEILCDYQGETNGGNGWLQLLRFHPAENTLIVSAYSPTLQQYRKAGPDGYTLSYAMDAK